mgnify:CR=1 FL=1
MTLLQGNQGMGDHVMAALFEPVLNQMLQAEMTKFLQAGRGERTEGPRDTGAEAIRASSLPPVSFRIPYDTSTASPM